MTTRIDVLTVAGSPRGVHPGEVEWPGVGGSELTLVRLFGNLARRGYDVRIYNDPRRPGVHDGVTWLPEDQFDRGVADRILVTFRGPHPLQDSRRRLLVGYSTDSATCGDYARDWYPFVDRMVGLSDFHRSDHLRRYGPVAQKMQVHDIGVDAEEYAGVARRNPGQVMFTSVPDRGLEGMRTVIWPQIREAVPDARLFITGSYGLWNGGRAEGNARHRAMWTATPAATFLGRIPRSRLVALQMSSEALVYPCTYDENFCIACAEAQVAGAYPITTRRGALATTNEFGCAAATYGELIERTIEFLRSRPEERAALQESCRRRAIARFSWDVVIEKLIRDVFTV